MQNRVNGLATKTLTEDTGDVRKLLQEFRCPKCFHQSGLVDSGNPASLATWRSGNHCMLTSIHTLSHLNGIALVPRRHPAHPFVDKFQYGRRIRGTRS